MKKGRPAKKGASPLRRRAEERLVERPPGGAPPAEEDAGRLLHEVEVHQLELELQNEELRAVRGELEASLKRYSELFEFAPVGYFAIASDGAIQEVNLAGARLVEVERQRLIGWRFARLVRENDRGVFNALLARVLSHEDEQLPSETCELTLDAGGAPIDARLTAAGLAGPVPMALVAVEDVTLRKRAEAALREESRNKDAFLAVLSHELRNPLTPIRSSLSVLERDDPAGERAREARAVIHRQVGHLTRIVDDLLDVTRIARGKIRLREERLELGELAWRTLDDHLASFEAGGIRLEREAGSGPLWVDADATRIAQVLGNLIANAVKFTSRGGSVWVTLRRDGRMAALSVRDTGVGITPEVRRHLFEPFSQGPQSLERAHGGLGLGLAMVKGLVEMHGGTVGVSSGGLGRGCEFTIWLPLASGPLEPAPPTSDHRPRPARVLVIEDNTDAATSLQDVLELEGHEVQVAFDGPGGLAAAKRFQPQVVLCDIGLPGMSGYEVARAIRSDDALRDVYLVALSGYALPEDVQHAVEAGFDRHVAKPPDLTELERLFAEARADRPVPLRDRPRP